MFRVYIYLYAHTVCMLDKVIRTCQLRNAYNLCFLLAYNIILTANIVSTIHALYIIIIMNLLCTAFVTSIYIYIMDPTSA